MNKRQKKKHLKREKEQLIQSIEFLNSAFTKAAASMREHYKTMPEGQEKVYHDFFITGFEYAVEQLGLAKELAEKVNEV